MGLKSVASVAIAEEAYSAPAENVGVQAEVSRARTSGLPLAVMLGIGLMALAVSLDRLSVRVGGLNLRFELIVGGLVALWALWRLVRRRSLALALHDMGVIEWCLVGWLAVNVVSSLLFSPARGESLKLTIIMAGLLVIYAACVMLFRSREAVVWAAVALVVVGSGVATLGLLCALYFDLFGPNFGVLLERFYRDDLFVVTPKVQSVFWEPNLFGSYSLSVSVLAFALGRAPAYKSPNWQRFFALAVAAGMCGVMLSMTRTVWLLEPLMLILLVGVALRLGLVRWRGVAMSLLVPAALGSIVGLAVGSSMPSPQWRMGQPWELTEAQIDKMVMDARHDPSQSISIATGAPGAPGASSAPTTLSATPVPVGQGSAFTDRVHELQEGVAPSIASRWRVYTDAFEGWTRRPILGWGAGAFPFVYPPPPEGGYWIANIILHILFDTGIVGLLVLAVAGGSAAWRAVRALRRPIAGWNTMQFALFGLLMAGVGLLAAYQVTDGSWLGFTWVYFAMLVAAGRLA